MKNFTFGGAKFFLLNGSMPLVKNLELDEGKEVNEAEEKEGKEG